MPNTQQIEAAAARREARRAAKEGTIARVEEEAQELSKLTEKQAEDRASGKSVAVRNQSESKIKAQSRKDRRAAAQAKAEEQAEKDVRVTPDIADEDEITAQIAAHKAAGRDLPLHLLNRIAKNADVAIKDEAREMANVVGKAAYNQSLGRVERNAHTRMKRVAKALEAGRQARTTE